MRRNAGNEERITHKYRQEIGLAAAVLLLLFQ